MEQKNDITSVIRQALEESDLTLETSSDGKTFVVRYPIEDPLKNLRLYISETILGLRINTFSPIQFDCNNTKLLYELALSTTLVNNCTQLAWFSINLEKRELQCALDYPVDNIALQPLDVVKYMGFVALLWESFAKRFFIVVYRGIKAVDAFKTENIQ